VAALAARLPRAGGFDAVGVGEGVGAVPIDALDGQGDGGRVAGWPRFDFAGRQS